MPLSVLVTVGSTSFPALTSHLTSAPVLTQLAALGATTLTVQHGSSPPPAAPPTPFPVTTFDYAPDLSALLDAADLVVSHAGAGTISEALAKRKRLVVVVNDALMHNHQTELADAMAARGCCVTLTAGELHQRFEAKLKEALAIREKDINPPERNPFAIANVLAEELGDVP